MTAETLGHQSIRKGGRSGPRKEKKVTVSLSEDRGWMLKMRVLAASLQGCLWSPFLSTSLTVFLEEGGGLGQMACIPAKWLPWSESQLPHLKMGTVISLPASQRCVLVKWGSESMRRPWPHVPSSSFYQPWTLSHVTIKIAWQASWRRGEEGECPTSCCGYCHFSRGFE